MIEDIRKRLLEKNQNWLCAVCGETGSGKSYAALKIAESIDPSFSIDRVVFTVKEFMELVTDKRIKGGQAIIFDEAGVEIGARDWYSQRNKAINYVLQTFRHQNLAVIFTTPSFSFIDSQTRRLFHAYIETKAINRKEKYVKVKWFIVSSNPKTDKYYFKYPVVYKGIKPIKIKITKIGKPSKKLINDYETKRGNFTKTLRADLLEDIKKAKEKAEKKPRSYEELAAEMKGIIKTKKLKQVTISKIGIELGISDFKARRIKEMI